MQSRTSSGLSSDVAALSNDVLSAIDRRRKRRRRPTATLRGATDPRAVIISWSGQAALPVGTVVLIESIGEAGGLVTVSRERSADQANDEASKGKQAAGGGGDSDGAAGEDEDAPDGPTYALSTTCLRPLERVLTAGAVVEVLEHVDEPPFLAVREGDILNILSEPSPSGAARVLAVAAQRRGDVSARGIVPLRAVTLVSLPPQHSSIASLPTAVSTASVTTMPPMSREARLQDQLNAATAALDAAAAQVAELIEDVAEMKKRMRDMAASAAVTDMAAAHASLARDLEKLRLRVCSGSATASVASLASVSSTGADDPAANTQLFDSTVLQQLKLSNLYSMSRGELRIRLVHLARQLEQVAEGKRIVEAKFADLTRVHSRILTIPAPQTSSSATLHASTDAAPVSAPPRSASARLLDHSDVSSADVSPETAMPEPQRRSGESGAVQRSQSLDSVSSMRSSDSSSRHSRTIDQVRDKVLREKRDREALLLENERLRSKATSWTTILASSIAACAIGVLLGHRVARL